MNEQKSWNKGRIVGTVIGLILLVVVVVNCTAIIEPGYKGVVFSLNGGLKDEVLDQGLRFVWPWENVTQYPVSTETVYLTKNSGEGSDQSMDVNTSDGKSVNVDVVYSYHMEPEKLPHIFTKFRRREAPEIESGYIKVQLKTVMQSVTTRYSVLGVYTEHRQEVTNEIQKKLSEILAKDGIILETISLADVRIDANTLKTIQSIADAQNRQEYLKREEANKRQEAINNKIEAEGKKQVSIIQAQGQAEANRILQQSLTPSIVQLEWIKKWDGKMPTVQGSGSPLIQMPAAK
ncbi:prohibitin family protein [Staphylospora marina]|uniref:prohibitin family protein n=1 Tax=Staphylospora marina TaxID=2490858 RepID=UPI0013DD9097|nr:prohibitin family protein [Staphylospora marina]